MAEHYHPEYDEDKAKRHTEDLAHSPELDFAEWDQEELEPSWPSHHIVDLLHDPGLRRPENTPVREAVLRQAEHEHGNHAVQRCMRAIAGTVQPEPLDDRRFVQRQPSGSSIEQDREVIQKSLRRRQEVAVGPVPIPYPSQAGAPPHKQRRIESAKPLPRQSASTRSQGKEAGTLKDVTSGPGRLHPAKTGSMNDLLIGAGGKSRLPDIDGEAIEDEHAPSLQLKVDPTLTQEAPAEDDELARRIEQKAGAGSQLDATTRATLEEGLGSELSGVRVHTGEEADRLARSVSSVAFTSGQDIFFRQGAYDPRSPEGLKLLAHEATHTVQQSQGPVAGTPSEGGVSISDPSDTFEQAAERSAERVLSEGRSSPKTPIARLFDDTEAEPVNVQRSLWDDAGASEAAESTPDPEQLAGAAARALAVNSIGRTTGFNQVPALGAMLNSTAGMLAQGGRVMSGALGAFGGMVRSSPGTEAGAGIGGLLNTPQPQRSIADLERQMEVSSEILGMVKKTPEDIIANIR